MAPAHDITITKCKPQQNFRHYKRRLIEDLFQIAPVK